MLLLLEHTPGHHAWAQRENEPSGRAAGTARRSAASKSSSAIAAATLRFTDPVNWWAIPSSICVDFPPTTARRKTLGVIEYVRRLEEVLIRTCADFRIPAERVSGLTGVWTAIRYD